MKNYFKTHFTEIMIIVMIINIITVLLLLTKVN